MRNAFFTGVESFLVETKENVLVMTQIMPLFLGHSLIYEEEDNVLGRNGGEILLVLGEPGVYCPL